MLLCAVLCCAVLSAGPGASNIIPDAVALSGTIRGFSKPAFAQLRQRVTEVFTGTAAMYRCNASVEWSEVRAAAGLRCLLGSGTLCLEKSNFRRCCWASQPDGLPDLPACCCLCLPACLPACCPHHLQVPYPPLVTDAAMTALALSAGAKVVGAGNAQQRAKPFMYAEDFAFMAEAVPAAFVMLGIRNESAGSVHGLHTPQFRLDESVLPLGAALHVQFALDFLAASSSNGGRGGGSGGGELGREEL